MRSERLVGTAYAFCGFARAGSRRALIAPLPPRNVGRGRRSGRVAGSPRKMACVTAEQDIASVAAQLASLTRDVERMAGELVALRERADLEQERADVQQERIDSAARE